MKRLMRRRRTVWSLALQILREKLRQLGLDEV
jgi:hypothetical protein